ncbi:hypothetical protein D6829_01440 [Candidatus Pacearchaeota archaeon]|nr:MAG: hypothetical protein D6829_01440 [Candidatus Pacearchaeota archaeon]
MEKRWVVYILLLLTFPLVSPTQCDNNDVIIRLSGKTNAHAETWDFNPPRYLEKICYSKIFGREIQNGHNCDPQRNLVLKLSGKTNAHAGGSSSGYTTTVCYRGLSCRLVQGQCSGSEKAIVKLSGKDNAHLEIPGGSNYPFSVCCSTGSVGSGRVEAMWWSLSSGGKTSWAYQGETVLLRLMNGFGNLPYAIYDLVNSKTVKTGKHNSGSPWNVSWTIDKSYLTGMKSEGKFNFTVDFSGKTYSPKEILSVSFCGDGKVSQGFEECDTGRSQQRRPTAGYGEVKTYCNATTCKITVVKGPYCGDGNVQKPQEQCDWGKDNGNLSKRKPNGDYCSSQCKLLNYNPNSWLKWKDLNGKEITSAYRGDTVVLYHSHFGRNPQGFEIVNRTGAKLASIPKTKVKYNSTSKELTAYYIIPNGLDIKKYSPLRFYEMGDKSRKSNYLTIKKKGGGGGGGGGNKIRDKDPKIKLTGVSCGSLINKGEEKKIIINFSDANDLLSGYVKIDGKKVKTFKELSSPQISVKYKFDKTGVVEIEAYAENSRGEKAQTAINVIVYDSKTSGKYAAPCIGNPSSFMKFKGDYVFFDASGTKAYQFSSGSHKSIALKNLKFSWEFSDGRNNPYKDGADERSYRFYKAFETRKGYNWAKLEVSVK